MQQIQKKKSREHIAQLYSKKLRLLFEAYQGLPPYGFWYFHFSKEKQKEREREKTLQEQPQVISDKEKN